MDRERIEKRMRLPLMTLCLAAVAGKEGDIRTAKELLLNEIERIVFDAQGAK